MVLAVLVFLGITLATALYGYHLAGHHQERTLKNYKKHFGLLNVATVINIALSIAACYFLDFHIKEVQKSNLAYLESN